MSRGESGISGTSANPGVIDLDAAVCSDGAPSARNLLVTVFGDVLLPAGPDVEVTVQQLTELLAPFGVNERLVRTSLSRIAREGVLTARAEGRRSFYRVSDEAQRTFRVADRRIYLAPSDAWDGSWTIVVLDGSEATSARRAELRQELAWAGLGTVAPNVMASPVVPAAAVAEVVERIGGFERVLVSRAEVVRGAGLIGPDELVRRSSELDKIERRYADFADRFERFDDATLTHLDPERAAKARILLVATFRRIALADPQLPASLLPAGWSGRRARDEARRVYAALAVRSDEHLTAVTGRPIVTEPGRFA
jgi:phenylacetic acid degradation operon negative regulatory protein